jgi:hypothetical protein
VVPIAVEVMVVVALGTAMMGLAVHSFRQAA